MKVKGKNYKSIWLDKKKSAIVVIDQRLSSYNYQGLKHAFTDALRIALKRQGKFDWKAARNRLKKYYER